MLGLELRELAAMQARSAYHQTVSYLTFEPSSSVAPRSRYLLGSRGSSPHAPSLLHPKGSIPITALVIIYQCCCVSGIRILRSWRLHPRRPVTWIRWDRPCHRRNRCEPSHLDPMNCTEKYSTASGVLYMLSHYMRDFKVYVQNSRFPVV